MSALKDALKGIASQVQLSSPLGFYLQKLAETIVSLVDGVGSVATALAQRFAQVTYMTTGVIIPVGTTADLFVGNGEAISFTTEVPNEKVQVTFTADRVNSALAGTGQYQFYLDGVAVGVLRENAGDIESTIAMTDLLTIASPGLHTVSVRATAATGNESVGAGTLVAVDYGAI